MATGTVSSSTASPPPQRNSPLLQPPAVTGNPSIFLTTGHKSNLTVAAADILSSRIATNIRSGSTGSTTAAATTGLNISSTNVSSVPSTISATATGSSSSSAVSSSSSGSSCFEVFSSSTGIGDITSLTAHAGGRNNSNIGHNYQANIIQLNESTTANKGTNSFNSNNNNKGNNNNISLTATSSSSYSGLNSSNNTNNNNNNNSTSSTSSSSSRLKRKQQHFPRVFSNPTIGNTDIMLSSYSSNCNTNNNTGGTTGTASFSMPNSSPTNLLINDFTNFPQNNLCSNDSNNSISSSTSSSSSSSNSNTSNSNSSTTSSSSSSSTSSSSTSSNNSNGAGVAAPANKKKSSMNQLFSLYKMKGKPWNLAYDGISNELNSSDSEDGGKLKNRHRLSAILRLNNNNNSSKSLDIVSSFSKRKQQHFPRVFTNTADISLSSSSSSSSSSSNSSLYCNNNNNNNNTENNSNSNKNYGKNMNGGSYSLLNSSSHKNNDKCSSLNNNNNNDKGSNSNNGGNNNSTGGNKHNNNNNNSNSSNCTDKPSLYTLKGKSWNSFYEGATVDNELNSNDPENGDKLKARNKSTVMRLDKSDMGLYGLCPETDPFYVVICAICNAVVKPQGLQKHMLNRHHNSYNYHNNHSNHQSQHLQQPIQQINHTSHHCQSLSNSSLGYSSLSLNSMNSSSSLGGGLLNRQPHNNNNSGTSSTTSTSINPNSPTTTTNLLCYQEINSKTEGYSPSQSQWVSSTTNIPINSINSSSTSILNVQGSSKSKSSSSKFRTKSSKNSLSSQILSNTTISSSASRNRSPQINGLPTSTITADSLIYPRDQQSSLSAASGLAVGNNSDNAVLLGSRSNLDSSINDVQQVTGTNNKESAGGAENLMNNPTIAANVVNNTYSFSSSSSSSSSPSSFASSLSAGGGSSSTSSKRNYANGSNKKRCVQVVEANKVIISKNSKERKYDPDKHCGVLTGDPPRPCTRSLTCKSHSLSMRRSVHGRSKSFDKLLIEHRAQKESSKMVLNSTTIPVILDFELSNSSSSTDLDRRSLQSVSSNSNLSTEAQPQSSSSSMSPISSLSSSIPTNGSTNGISTVGTGGGGLITGVTAVVSSTTDNGSVLSGEETSGGGGSGGVPFSYRYFRYVTVNEILGSIDIIIQTVRANNGYLQLNLTRNLNGGSLLLSSPKLIPSCRNRSGRHNRKHHHHYHRSATTSKLLNNNEVTDVNEATSDIIVDKNDKSSYNNNNNNNSNFVEPSSSVEVLKRPLRLTLNENEEDFKRLKLNISSNYVTTNPLSTSSSTAAISSNLVVSRRHNQQEQQHKKNRICNYGDDDSSELDTSGIPLAFEILTKYISEKNPNKIISGSLLLDTDTCIILANFNHVKNWTQFDNEIEVERLILNAIEPYGIVCNNNNEIIITEKVFTIPDPDNDDNGEFIIFTHRNLNEEEIMYICPELSINELITKPLTVALPLINRKHSDEEEEDDENDNNHGDNDDNDNSSNNNHSNSKNNRKKGTNLVNQFNLMKFLPMLYCRSIKTETENDEFREQLIIDSTISHNKINSKGKHSNNNEKIVNAKEIKIQDSSTVDKSANQFSKSPSSAININKNFNKINTNNSKIDNNNMGNSQQFSFELNYNDITQNERLGIAFYNDATNICDHSERSKISSGGNGTNYNDITAFSLSALPSVSIGGENSSSINSIDYMSSFVDLQQSSVSIPSTTTGLTTIPSISLLPSSSSSSSSTNITNSSTSGKMLPIGDRFSVGIRQQQQQQLHPHHQQQMCYSTTSSSIGQYNNLNISTTGNNILTAAPSDYFHSVDMCSFELMSCDDPSSMEVMPMNITTSNHHHQQQQQHNNENLLNSENNSISLPMYQVTATDVAKTLSALQPLMDVTQSHQFDISTFATISSLAAAAAAAAVTNGNNFGNISELNNNNNNNGDHSFINNIYNNGDFINNDLKLAQSMMTIVSDLDENDLGIADGIPIDINMKNVNTTAINVANCKNKKLSELELSITTEGNNNNIIKSSNEKENAQSKTISSIGTGSQLISTSTLSSSVSVALSPPINRDYPVYDSFPKPLFVNNFGLCRLRGTTTFKKHIHGMRETDPNTQSILFNFNGLVEDGLKSLVMK